MIAGNFLCTVNDVLRVLDGSSDFERIAPRAEDGQCFAWRLSALSCDSRVRLLALVHFRAIEKPPQHQGKKLGALRPSGDSLLVAWLRANPGEWSMKQIADARGITLSGVRDACDLARCHLNKRRLQISGRPLLISLKVS